ncbi:MULTISPECIES: restriction endonuclease [Spirulina sp. CCY15215]|uniref:restriction endonuclease n=1 Tax=Spirulina sp. CCY15215 TaxID=2767591 RepID=UPI00195271AE|nr:restriction endonuclease [Spirulina major]
MATSVEYERAIATLQWEELRSLWENIEQGNTTPDWEPGKAFEYLVLRAFQLDGATVRYPYRVRLFEENVEQIDGAVYCSGLSCIVESKDWAKDVDIEPIAKLRNQLSRRPASTVGLVFSRKGFTNPARTLVAFSAQSTILLWNGEEIQYSLEQEKIREFLMSKYRACVEEGIPDFDFRGVV